MTDESENFRISGGGQGSEGSGNSVSSENVSTSTPDVTVETCKSNVTITTIGNSNVEPIWTGGPVGGQEDYNNYYFNTPISYPHNGYYFQNYGPPPPPNLGMSQNGPFQPRRTPFGPSGQQRHSGNSSGGLSRFPPYPFQQHQRPPLRPVKTNTGIYGKPSGNMVIQANYRRNYPPKGPFSLPYDAPPMGGENEGIYQSDRNGTGPLDNMRSLEQYLADMMRTEQAQSQPPHEGKWSYGSGGSVEDGGMIGGSYLLEEVDVGGVSRISPRSISLIGLSGAPPSLEGSERFSRKVFVGGLPPDIDEEEITASFRRFGPLVVDWPHKAESKSYFPPKGYAFLLFQEETSVQGLIDACIADDDKLYLCVSSPTIKDKPVQIRPWRLTDADFVLDATMPLDPRKTVFVGGVPRPLKAVELAMIMDRLYGGVCYAGIDTDPELKYPKGAGRVAFSNQQSYIAAISARFVQLQHGDIDKRVEVKPYVLDDQLCDECAGGRCGGKFAPFFCANVTCLQYYCEQCWATIHSRPGREYHKPLVKEGADRPRSLPYRPNYYRRLVTVNSQV